jgi:Kef-type K+ transport system membrane component KefB
METQIQVHDFFLILAIILIAAKIFGELFAYFKLPSVIGEVFAGLIIGPSFLGIVEPNFILKILAEIGIILLLFEVGLETDMDKLKQAGVKAFIVAIAGAFFPFAFGALLSYYVFELPLVVSLFIGGALTATSIGITIRALKDIDKHRTAVAQIVLGAAVVDDILGVVLLITIYDFVITGEVNIYNLLKILFLIGVFFALAPVLAKFLSKAIYVYDKKFSKSDGFVVTTIISLILIFAYLSHFFNAPEILGAFTAGIALSRRFFLPFGISFQTDPDFINRIESYLKPIANIFVPIFFVMVGISINLKVIDLGSPSLWITGFLLVIIAILGKILGSFLIKNISFLKRIIIGTAMVPRGEVGLIFAELGRSTNILKPDIYAVLVFVIIITTIIPPVLLKWLFKYEKETEEQS